MDQLINNCVTFLNNIGRGFCDYAGTMFIQSSVLIIILLVVNLLIRKRVRATFRYWIWMLVFIKLILPPALSLPTGIGNLFGDYFIVNSSVTEKSEDIIVNGNEILPESVRIASTEFLPQAQPSQNNYQPITQKLSDTPETPAPIEKATSNMNPLTWQGGAFLIWFVGVLVLSVLLIQRIFFVKGLIAQSEPAKNRLIETLQECCEQLGIHKNIQLRLSHNASSPAVCGVFNPVILIPANLLGRISCEKFRAVLIHELSHIKRRDLWINCIQTILQILYFYNPLLWLANAVVRRIREQAVDEMVLVALGAEAKSYSNTLIDIAEMAFSRPALSLRLVGVVESKKALSERIKHILSRPIPKSAKLGIFGLIIVIITAAILLPMAKGKDINDEEKFKEEFKKQIPLPKLTAHQYYKHGEQIPIKIKSINNNQWKSPFNDMNFDNSDKVVCFFTIDGKEYNSRNIFGPFSAGGSSLNIPDVLNVPLKLAIGKHSVAFGWKDIDVTNPDKPEKPVHFDRLMTKSVEFEVVENVPDDYYSQVYEQGWDEILAENIDVEFTDRSQKYSYTGSLLTLVVKPLPFEIAFDIYAQAEGSVEREYTGKIARQANSKDGYFIVFCDHKIESLDWDNVGQKRYRLILVPSEEAAKANPPINNYYSREYVTDWITFEKSDQFDLHYQTQLRREELNKIERYGGTIKADKPVDLDRLGRRWQGDADDIKLPPEGFELGWSSENGGILKINPDSNVRMLWFPQYTTFWNYLRPVDEIKPRLVELPDSKTFEINPPDNKSTIIAVRSSENKIYFVQVSKVNDKRAKLTWYQVEEKESTDFKATLPNGVTVELLGVCEHPSEGKQWWLPNGDTLTLEPYWMTDNGNYVSVSDKEKAYVFIMCSDMLDMYDLTYETELGIHGSGPVWDKYGSFIDNCRAMYTKFPKKIKQSYVHIGIKPKSSGKNNAKKYEWITFKNVSLEANVKTDVQVEIQNEYTIGFVVDGSGNGIAGVTMEYLQRNIEDSNNAQSQTIQTREDGSFIIPDVEPGKSVYFHNVNAPGYDNRELVSLGRNKDGSFSEANRKIILYHTCSIKGKVLDTEGIPLANAPLSLSTTNDSGAISNHLRAISDGNGNFVIKDVPPGVHMLYYPWEGPTREEVDQGIWDKYTKEGESYPSAPIEGVLSAQIIEISEGKDINDIIVNLSKSTCSLTGQVRDSAGQNVPGAKVSLYYKVPGVTDSVNGRGYEPAVTDSNGTYRLDNLPAGDWYIRAWHDSIEEPFNVEPVELISDRTVHLNMQLGGKLETPDGQGINTHAETVTFKNVSLEANVKTDVQVEIQNGLPTVDLENNQKAKIAFAPISEFVIYDKVESGDYLIDFDRGITLSMPKDFEWNSENALEWTEENGVDAGGATQEEIHGLIGWDIIVLPCSNDYWETAKANSLFNQQAWQLLKEGGSQVYMTAKGELPQTYMFKTREGSIGILQILGFTDNPKGVRIRYKIIQKTDMQIMIPDYNGNQSVLSEQKDEIIGIINEANGNIGEVTAEHGDAVYGNNIQYTPGLYLGRVIKENKIQIIDPYVIENQFGIPIIKIKTLSESRTLPIGTIGWIMLKNTSFKDWFIAYENNPREAGVQTESEKPAGQNEIETTKSIESAVRNSSTKQNEVEITWGEIQNGLKCGLIKPAFKWNLENSPYLALVLSNEGQTPFSFTPSSEVHCEIEVDGQWYVWARPKPDQVDSFLLKDQGSIQIDLSDSWTLLKEPNQLQYRQGGENFRGERLKLTPGKHTFRVKFRPLEWLEDYQKGGDDLFVISDPVEIEFLPETEKTDEQPPQQLIKETDKQNKPRIVFQPDVITLKKTQKEIDDFMKNELGVEHEYFSELSDTQAEKFKDWVSTLSGSNIASSPRALAYEGESSKMNVTTVEEFITDYEKDANFPTGYKAKSSKVNTGLEIEFKPDVIEENKPIVLSLNIKQYDIFEVIEKTHESGDKIRFPMITSKEIVTQICIEKGKYYLKFLAGLNEISGFSNNINESKEKTILLIKTDVLGDI